MEDSIASTREPIYYSVEMERLGAPLKQAEENLASRGIKLVFYMVPNKGAGRVQRVYAIIREGVQEHSKADLLYEYLKEKDDCDVLPPG